MKKNVLKTVSTILFLSLITGCNDNISSSSTVPSSTHSSEVKQKSFKRMLKDISSQNITYHSDFEYYFYYEDEGKEEKQTMQRFDVYAKITEDAYDVIGYDYGTGRVETYSHLYKDENGYVIYKDIDINNNLVVNYAVGSDGKKFKWEDSVYYNLIQYMDEDDFKKISETKYEYIGKLNDLPLNMIHTAVPTSDFDLESLIVRVKDNAIESFVFQEKESDEVYEGCMFGSILTVRFEDIGTTTVDDVVPYEVKEENNALGLALEHIRKAKNYSIDSDGILDDGSSMHFQTTDITSKDIIQYQAIDNGTYTAGVHTTDDGIYVFESVGNYLLGAKANDGVTVQSFLPTFAFSKDVFKYIGEEEGYKVYSPYSSMRTVLDYVDVLMGYSDAYYAPAGDIYFYVDSSNKLNRIEFPVYVNTVSQPLVAINVLTYSNFSGVSISKSTWNSFVTEIPNTGNSSWSDEAYKFNMNIADSKEIEMTVAEVLEKTTGDANYIPYFIPANSLFSVSGNYSKVDEAVYLNLSPLTECDEKFFSDAKAILSSSGFSYILEEDEEGFMKIERYIKNNVMVEFITMEGQFLEIMINLPVGEFINL